MANLHGWEESSPLDADDVNEGALRIRETKGAIRERMNRDHIIGGPLHTSPTSDDSGGADGNDTGYHRRITMIENAADSDQSSTVLARVNTLNGVGGSGSTKKATEIWLQSYTREAAVDQYIMYKGSNYTNKEVATTTQIQTLTSKTLTSPVINTPEVVGGTVDNAIIGASTAVAATFTNLTSNDNTVLGSAVSDTVTLNAKVQGNVGTGAGSMQAGITGEIKMFGGIAAPTGWLVCDGASYGDGVVDYIALFGVIGYKYGGTESSGVFNVPDLRGRVPVGANKAGVSGAGYIGRDDDGSATATIRDLGVSGGKEKHTLTGAESGTSVHTHANDNPDHTHPYTGVAGGERQAHSTGGGAAYGSGILTGRITDPATSGITITATVATAATTSHTNEQPYVTVNFIIKT